jgi:hypothetical protein
MKQPRKQLIGLLRRQNGSEPTLSGGPSRMRSSGTKQSKCAKRISDSRIPSKVRKPGNFLKNGRNEVVRDLVGGPARTCGLPRVCVGTCDSLRMVSRVSLSKRAGQLAPGHWVEVKRAMGATLGWRELTDLAHASGISKPTVTSPTVGLVATFFLWRSVTYSSAIPGLCIEAHRTKPKHRVLLSRCATYVAGARTTVAALNRFRTQFRPC